MNMLSTVFMSRDKYMQKYVAERNKSRALPASGTISKSDFYRETNGRGLLISGGCYEERSTLIIGLLSGNQGKVIVIHNGNDHLTAANLRRYSISASDWNTNVYGHDSKQYLLTLLTKDDKDRELAFFWTFSFEVLEVLGLPLTLENLRSIDWLGTDWQEKLYMTYDPYQRNNDLINRFDTKMAERACKAIPKLERLARAQDTGSISLDDWYRSNSRVLTKMVYGSDCETSKLAMEQVEALAQSGARFTLILDDVYLRDVGVIRDNLKNVNLILSAEDVTRFDERFVNRNCGIVMFRHNYESAKRLSETYFGSYEKVEYEFNTGKSRSFMSLPTSNDGYTLRKKIELRLKPEDIANLPRGSAYVRLLDGKAGILEF